MTEKKNIDLLGIGNAITDILVKVDYNFLEKMELNIGAMQLTDYETINKTTAKIWKIDSLINLERSLLPTTRMGGHFVQGHVDNVISIKSINKMDDSAVWQFYLPQNLKRYIVRKGSVCLDGISLTVADKKDDYFNVALIPHTLKKTTWSEKKIDDLINIEVDIMAKYIESILRD